MNKFYFIRHAQSIANKEDLLEGWLDSPLTENGKEQAQRLSKVIDKDFDVIYCSPSLRTRQTLAILMQNGIQCSQNVIYDDRLKELSLGIFERKNYNNFSVDEKEQLRKVFKGENFTDHGGESLQGLDLRLTPIWQTIFNESLQNNYENTLIVTHNSAMRRLFQKMKIQIKDKDTSNASGYIITYQNDSFTVQSEIGPD